MPPAPAARSPTQPRKASRPASPGSLLLLQASIQAWLRPANLGARCSIGCTATERALGRTGECRGCRAGKDCKPVQPTDKHLNCDWLIGSANREAGQVTVLNLTARCRWLDIIVIDLRRGSATATSTGLLPLLLPLAPLPVNLLAFAFPFSDLVTNSKRLASLRQALDAPVKDWSVGSSRLVPRRAVLLTLIVTSSPRFPPLRLAPASTDLLIAACVGPLGQRRRGEFRTEAPIGCLCSTGSQTADIALLLGANPDSARAQAGVLSAASPVFRAMLTDATGCESAPAACTPDLATISWAAIRRRACACMLHRQGPGDLWTSRGVRLLDRAGRARLATSTRSKVFNLQAQVSSLLQLCGSRISELLRIGQTAGRSSPLGHPRERVFFAQLSCVPNLACLLRARGIQAGIAPAFERSTSWLTIRRRPSPRPHRRRAFLPVPAELPATCWSAWPNDNLADWTIGEASSTALAALACSAGRPLAVGVDGGGGEPSLLRLLSLRSRFPLDARRPACSPRAAKRRLRRELHALIGPLPQTAAAANPKRAGPADRKRRCAGAYEELLGRRGPEPLVTSSQRRSPEELDADSAEAEGSNSADLYRPCWPGLAPPRSALRLCQPIDFIVVSGHFVERHPYDILESTVRPAGGVLLTPCSPAGSVGSLSCKIIDRCCTKLHYSAVRFAKSLASATKTLRYPSLCFKRQQQPPHVPPLPDNKDCMNRLRRT
uniref:FGGY_N domain-containing protein n=1 Tax=Macrostomum lignano TaxID=282301 RepID=A0A1I8FFR5_9PLAT